MIGAVSSSPSLRPLSAPADNDNRRARSLHGDRQTEPSPSRTPDNNRLTEEQQEQVEELKRVDRRVRRHEAAHEAAAGGLSRGKSFSYTQGPDGKQYATAGEVQIDMAPVPGDPQATIAKMQRVRAAALAPADPSPQDRSVAAQAARTEAQARTELRQAQRGDSPSPLSERSASQSGSGETAKNSSRNDSAAAVARFTDYSLPTGTIVDTRA